MTTIYNQMRSVRLQPIVQKPLKDLKAEERVQRILENLKKKPE